MLSGVFTTSSQTDGLRLHKLWVSTPALPQVVFATSSVSTTYGFMRSLSELATQAFTHGIYVNNGASGMFVHTIHTPNNKYYKGE